MTDQDETTKALVEAVRAALVMDGPVCLGDLAETLGDWDAAHAPPKPTPQEPPQRCVDCVHGNGLVCAREREEANGWIVSHWEDDDAPQPIPCPAFERKGGDDE